MMVIRFAVKQIAKIIFSRYFTNNLVAEKICTFAVPKILSAPGGLTY